jgi:hypothetical protein
MTGMHASHAESKDELHAFPSLSLQEEEIIPEHQTAKKEKKKTKMKNTKLKEKKLLQETTFSLFSNEKNECQEERIMNNKNNECQE